jgi:hypothetical protein
LTASRRSVEALRVSSHHAKVIVLNRRGRAFADATVTFA